MSSHFQGSRVGVCIVIALGDKPHNNKCHLTSFVLGFIAEQIYIMESLWSALSSCPGYVPSKDLVHPEPTGDRFILERQR